jgi:hypothetical protein
VFYRTDRSVLYGYTTAWVPLESFAAMTLYVSTTGTNDTAHGWASGADAFLTLAYAFSQIPGSFGGNVVVIVEAGTYSETTPTLGGKTPTGSFTIEIRGSVTLGATQTIASQVQASTATPTQGTVTVTGAGWSATGEGEHVGKLVKFTKVAGSSPSIDTYRVVQSNTADTLTLVGNPVTGLAANDTFAFVTHNTVISTTGTTYGSRWQQPGLLLNLLKFSNTYATGGIGVSCEAGMTVQFCNIYATNCLRTGAGLSAMAVTIQNSSLTTIGTAASRYGILLFTPSFVAFQQSMLRNGGAYTTLPGVTVGPGSVFQHRDNSTICGSSGYNFEQGALVNADGVFEQRIGGFILRCTVGIAGPGTTLVSNAPGTVFANCTANVQGTSGLHGSTGTLRGLHVVEGSAALTAGTVQVTLTGAAAGFTSATSYTVLLASSLNDRTLKVVNGSATQFTITSSDLTDTDTVRYVVIGS